MSTNTIWIVVGLICAGSVLTCCGGGVGLYFLAHWTINKVHVTDHVKIRRMTADMIEITIPEQFVPKEGTDMLGLAVAKYEWCPAGNCSVDNPVALILESFSLQGNDFDLSEWEDDVRAMLSEFKDGQREDWVLDLRGQRVKMAFVTGEKKPHDPDEDSASDADQQAPHLQKPRTAVSHKANPNAPDADAGHPAPEAETGSRVCWIYGFVPGKHGRCTLTLEIPADQYDDELIMTMLKSIR